jgi:molecular chaperone GrpE
MTHAHHLHGGPSPKEQNYLDGWQRTLAELKNFQQRTREQYLSQSIQVKRQLLEPLLQLADNFQAIVAHIPTELKDNAWAQGVLHVARQFDQVLTDYQLKKIGAAGEVFDPTKHEAVEHVPGDTESGSVIEVVQVGYQLDDTVMRPAKVKVAV